GDEHHTAQADPLGAGDRIAHDLQRAEERHRAERLLQRPGALEAKRLSPRHVCLEASRIECAVRNELRDGDRKSHVLAPISMRPRLTLAPLLPHNPSADDRDCHRVYALGASLTLAQETTVHTLDPGEAVCGQDEPGVNDGARSLGVTRSMR